VIVCVIVLVGVSVRISVGGGCSLSRRRRWQQGFMRRRWATWLGMNVFARTAWNGRGAARAQCLVNCSS